jgi:hypothetical protein
MKSANAIKNYRKSGIAVRKDLRSHAIQSNSDWKRDGCPRSRF